MKERKVKMLIHEHFKKSMKKNQETWTKTNRMDLCTSAGDSAPMKT